MTRHRTTPSLSRARCVSSTRRASAALNLHYKNDEAFEIEYTPYRVDSGLRIGTPSTVGNGTAVRLGSCGSSPKRLWVVDGSTNTDGYYTERLHYFSAAGSDYDNQLWADVS
jgi:hypothetical protein